MQSQFLNAHACKTATTLEVQSLWSVGVVPRISEGHWSTDVRFLVVEALSLHRLSHPGQKPCPWTIKVSDSRQLGIFLGGTLMFLQSFPLWTTVQITTFIAIYMPIYIIIIIILSAFKFISFDYLLHIYGNAWVLVINDQIILSCMKYPTVHFA